ncbi:hypothetical protein CDAR_95211 [Caerostris darwini]|uniref:Uncharacterized protein n=1 Tax=Caerostris darwini TaxID=1538125 RepID=A0AAV4PL74_9ARAC|nr:hypothetical protein CDAR_95211 [Caerostris darwini]
MSDFTEPPHTDSTCCWCRRACAPEQLVLCESVRSMAARFAEYWVLTVEATDTVTMIDINQIETVKNRKNLSAIILCCAKEEMAAEMGAALLKTGINSGNTESYGIDKWESFPRLCFLLLDVAADSVRET